MNILELKTGDKIWVDHVNDKDPKNPVHIIEERTIEVPDQLDDEYFKFFWKSKKLNGQFILPKNTKIDKIISVSKDGNEVYMFFKSKVLREFMKSLEEYNIKYELK